MPPSTDWFDFRLISSHWWFESLLRLVLAAILGGVIGIERENAGRQAGFRTLLLVCVGAALAMIVSLSMASAIFPITVEHVQVDPGRIAYSVLAGIGFIGAGLIVRDNGRISGLTSAAALWAVAALGLASGAGLYVVSVLSALIIVVALRTLERIDGWLPRTEIRVLTLRRPWTSGGVRETVDALRRAKLDVQAVSFRRSPDLAYVEIDVRIAFRSTQHYLNIEETLLGEPHCLVIGLRES